MDKKGYRILVLDDDPDIGMMIKLMLEYRGYFVILVERAEKAEKIIRDDKVDLLIMDMLLSGTNGVDVCKRLKQAGKLPILMISAHPNAKEICLAAGADDFIAKHFDMQDLLSSIDNIMHQQERK